MLEPVPLRPLQSAEPSLAEILANVQTPAPVPLAPAPKPSLWTSIAATLADPRFQQLLMTLGSSGGPGTVGYAIGQAGTQFLQGRLEGELLARMLEGDDPNEVFGSREAQALLPENRQALLAQAVQQRQLAQADRGLDVEQQRADIQQTQVEGGLELQGEDLLLRRYLAENQLEDADLDRLLRERLGLLGDETTRRGQDLHLEGVRLNSEAISGRALSGAPLSSELDAEIQALQLEFIPQMEQGGAATLNRIGTNPADERTLIANLPPEAAQEYLTRRAEIVAGFSERRAAAVREQANSRRTTTRGSATGQSAEVNAAREATDAVGATQGNPKAVRFSDAQTRRDLRGQWLYIPDSPQGPVVGYMDENGRFINYRPVSE